MESTSNKSKETLHESANAAGKAFNETNTALMDMYSKQLNLLVGFYTNFLNSVMGSNRSWERDGSSYTNMFQNSDYTKSFFNFDSTKSGPQNPFMATFVKTYHQMADYNRNLLASFNSELKNTHVDWTEINKRYKETIDTRMEAYRNVFKSATEACNKQLDASVETNKKMMEDINTQFNSVVKQTQKFWTDILNTSKNIIKEEKFDKEPTQNEFRKKSHVPVNNLADHK